MEKRQAFILKLIVDEHVRTAEPVSSQALSSRFAIPISSATIRNEMAELEDLGFIYQPHTSSGRVPTENGYRFYLAHFLRLRPSRAAPELRRALDDVRSLEQRVQMLGHRLAQMSGEAVMLASHGQASALGVANLLRKPDFRSEDTLLELAEDIERLEAAAEEVIGIAEGEVKVLIGDENPLGRRLATVVVRHRLANGAVGGLSIVGPLRMHYARNVSLLAEAKKVLDEFDINV